MIAHTGPSFDTVSLVFSRMLLVGIALYALYAVVDLWRKQAPIATDRSIPRAILWFTGGWAAVEAAIGIALLLTTADAVNSGWLRAFYAMSLVWPTFGLAWIVHVGAKASPKTYIRIVDQDTGETRLVRVKEKAGNEE